MKNNPIIHLTSFEIRSIPANAMPKTDYSEMITVRMSSKMYKELYDASKREFITIAQYVRKLIREATDKK